MAGLADAAIALASRPPPPGEKLPSKTETRRVSALKLEKGGGPTPEEIRKLVAAVNKR